MNKSQKSRFKVRLITILAVSSLLIPLALGNFHKPNIATAAESVTSQKVNYQPYSYANAVSRAAPAVVSIQTTKEIPVDQHPLLQDPFYRFFFGSPGAEQDIPQADRLQHGLGSGVIVDKDGHILTNNHVIKDTKSIIVKLADGRSSQAEIVGTDPQTDLAVLKIELENLPSIYLGDSNKLLVGDVVLAIGNPFGFNSTVTQGIVSATGSVQSRTSSSQFFGALLDNLIQTDAAINPGNSGGALIDASGSIIGINTAIISRTGGSQGIGFAIPINTAKQVMAALINEGKIVRGWIGAQLNDISDDMRQYLNYHDRYGVYVQATIRNGPAQKSGILPGDIITKIDEKRAKDLLATVRLISDLPPSESYTFEIFRKGKYLKYSVQIEERPKQN